MHADCQLRLRRRRRPHRDPSARRRRCARLAAMALVTDVAGTHGFDNARLARLDAHFRRRVDDGRLPGWQILVSRGGDLVHAASAGWRDTGRKVAWGDDPVVRIFSMTKPITSVAAMMLYEEGGF